jgi:uncharacterized protein YdeI (YjbR/CyaY-like superfamily)
VTTANSDARIDAYIAKAQPFAQEILIHLRDLLHKASPEVEETVKWGMPFFVVRGVILAHLAGFKQHCSLGLWGPEMAAILGVESGSDEKGGGMGSFGKITSLKDLPGDKVLLGYFRQAVGFITRGERTTSLTRAPKKKVQPAPEVPTDLAVALKKNKAAAATFGGFSPSAKREYTEWIVEAKRAETREKRLAQAIEWMAEGKQRNWKYQNC